VKVYRVTLQLRTLENDPTNFVIVEYAAEDYHASWVGARTVCRLGTAFRDEVKLKEPREFWQRVETADGTTVRQKFHCAPGAYTVRNIFVEGTRKRGVKRMTFLSAEQIVQVIRQRELEITPELEALLQSLLAGSEGVKVTVATARRLGLEALFGPARPPDEGRVAEG